MMPLATAMSSSWPTSVIPTADAMLFSESGIGSSDSGTSRPSGVVASGAVPSGVVASGAVPSGAVPSGVVASGAAGGVIPPRSRSPEASWDAAESSGFCETCQAATPRTSATAEVTAAIATAMRVRLRWLRYLVSQASAAGLPGRYPGA